MIDNDKSERVRPGMNPQVVLDHFDEQERKILNRIARDWYLTNGGSNISLSPTSHYRYALIKPTDIFQDMFNIDREMVVLFSPYENFEPRTLDAIPAATSKHQALRLERICSVLVSKDPEVGYKLKELLKNDQEAQIVVPFSYDELLSTNADPYFFRNRFIEHFYARDLFASESPLRKDLYFFGRTDLVHSLINRDTDPTKCPAYSACEKQAKHLLSLVFSVGSRKSTGSPRLYRLPDTSIPSTSVEPCTSSQFSWNVRKQNNLNVRLGQLDDYTGAQAPVLFEKHLRRMSERLGSKTIMLIFDEVENITPTVSPSEHWREGTDFVFFLADGPLPVSINITTVFVSPRWDKPIMCGTSYYKGTLINPLFAQVPLGVYPWFRCSTDERNGA